MSFLLKPIESLSEIIEIIRDFGQLKYLNMHVKLAQTKIKKSSLWSQRGKWSVCKFGPCRATMWKYEYYVLRDWRYGWNANLSHTEEVSTKNVMHVWVCVCVCCVYAWRRSVNICLLTRAPTQRHAHVHARTLNIKLIKSFKSVIKKIVLLFTRF